MDIFPTKSDRSATKRLIIALKKLIKAAVHFSPRKNELIQIRLGITEIDGIRT